MDNQITILQINAAHAAELSVLAKNIYQQHYLHLWEDGGANWYMNEYAYPENILQKELEDKNNLYCIAYHKSKAIGYLKIKINETLKGYEELNALEVERIYIDGSVTGKGIGKQLMQFVFDIAKQQKKDIVFLKAMDTSFDAIAFYRKLGFELCGTFQLPMPTFKLMKAAFRGMVILKKNVD
ncbi:MAG: GNAT family N-acetyltransferase [Bacteroidota bacterium]|nr:GNAT family N-acetyltransferase [Bacteroidota bacterium]